MWSDGCINPISSDDELYNSLLQVQGDSPSAKSHFLGKVKPKKKNEVELISKKVKILGDGINVSLSLKL